MTLKTRKPTGAVPWPVVLIEGPEKSGKSWCAAEFSASDKVGQTYWIDLAEGAADEYGAVPGARYLIVEHDGSYGAVLAAVEDIKQEARKAAEAGEPPVVLVVDSMTAEWEMLKDWASSRARDSDAGQKILRQDKNADVPVSMNLWNDAAARHRRLMTQLLTFPGVVVITARGKETAKVDGAGKPVKNAKDYSVEGHKSLAFDATVWVRLSRDQPPTVIGARSVHTGVRPGIDKPEPLTDFTIEWLVFEALKCDPTGAKVRDFRETSEVQRARREVWEAAQKIGWDKGKLAAAFAEDNGGAAILDAGVAELDGFRDFLRLCLQQPEGGAE
jgi:hypothetical protein